MDDVIIINETDDIFKKLYEKNIDIREIYLQISSIGKKVSNNKIGYFQFKCNGEFYKICIIPKVISSKDGDYQDAFITYIKGYYELLKKYPNISKNYIPNNILDISLKQSGTVKQNSFDDILYYKYFDALNSAKAFFQRYKSFTSKKIDFSSQSIKYELNIKKNITEINKSIIHQFKNEDFSYSVIASVTLKVLEYFINYKIKHFKDAQDIRTVAISLKNYINKKFITNEFNFKIEDLAQNKIKRYFKTKPQKILYYCLLILVGFEGYFKGENEVSFSTKLDNMLSITFDASNVFEYYVYDRLVSEYGIEKVFFIKPNSNDVVELYYLLQSDNNNMSVTKINELKSEPDFIVSETNGSVVVDAKWKIINNYSEISNEDISKLYRDCLIRNTSSGVLVYPKISPQIDTNYKYSLNCYSGFSFKLKEVNVI